MCTVQIPNHCSYNIVTVHSDMPSLGFKANSLGPEYYINICTQSPSNQRFYRQIAGHYKGGGASDRGRPGDEGGAEYKTVLGCVHHAFTQPN